MSRYPFRPILTKDDEFDAGSGRNLPIRALRLITLMPGFTVLWPSAPVPVDAAGIYPLELLEDLPDGKRNLKDMLEARGHAG